MKIIVNHLTRMQPGYFCVAGLETEARQHIRPVLESQLPVELLWRQGGPFQLGAVLDLGPTRFIGRVPEVEDQLFDRHNVRCEGQLDERQLYEANVDVARNSLSDVFGIPMPVVDGTCAVPENHGLFSLGCYWAERGQLIFSRQYDRQRLRFRMMHEGHPLSVPVTDIRLYEADHRTVAMATANAYATALQKLDRVLVSIGLSRPFRKSEDQTAMHWLQVNNIHLPPQGDPNSKGA